MNKEKNKQLVKLRKQLENKRKTYIDLAVANVETAKKYIDTGYTSQILKEADKYKTTATENDGVIALLDILIGDKSE